MCQGAWLSSPARGAFHSPQCFQSVVCVLVLGFFPFVNPPSFGPGERKGWKEQKKSHPDSCHGAAAKRRLFQCGKWGCLQQKGRSVLYHSLWLHRAAWPGEETPRQVSPSPSTAVIQGSAKQARAMLTVLPGVAPAAPLALNPKMGLSYLGCPIYHDAGAKVLPYRYSLLQELTNNIYKTSQYRKLS